MHIILIFDIIFVNIFLCLMRNRYFYMPTLKYFPVCVAYSLYLHTLRVKSTIVYTEHIWNVTVIIFIVYKSEKSE